jgi:putative membrane protein
MRPLAPGRVMYAGHPGIWPGIVLLLVVIAVVIGAVVIARVFAHRPAQHVGPVAPLPPPAPPNTPLRILEERFARGEIDEAEFRSRRDVLRS